MIDRELYPEIDMDFVDKRLPEVDELFDRQALRNTSTATWYIAAKMENNRGHLNDLGYYANQVRNAGCHGGIIAGQYVREAVYVSLYKGYKQGVYNHEDLDNYYLEILPYFSDFMLIDYTKGDKTLVFNPNTPGNHTIMGIIAARQPWEMRDFFKYYHAFKAKGYTPLFSLYLCHFFKNTAGRTRSGFHSDSDVFADSSTRLSNFVDLTKGKFRDPRGSFNHRNKNGVFAALGSRESSPSEKQRLFSTSPLHLDDHDPDNMYVTSLGFRLPKVSSSLQSVNKLCELVEKRLETVSEEDKGALKCAV